MKFFTLLLIFIPQTMSNFSTIGINIEKIESAVVDKPVKQTVTLTNYYPSESETDSTPNITASGFKIDVSNPDKHKIIAVSRDLKRKGWKFGKKVRIKKAGKYNGVYTIRDIMNKRYNKRIDVLVGDAHSPIKLKNVEVTLIN